MTSFDTLLNVCVISLSITDRIQHMQAKTVKHIMSSMHFIVTE